MQQQSPPDPARIQALLKAFSESPGASPAAFAAELQRSFGLPGSPPTDAHGTIDTRVTVLVLPAADVQKLLPTGLGLAPQPVVPSGYHPVYILSSHDTFQAWFGDMDYQEMMLAVPYVQIDEPRGRYPGPYIYMPRLYLNDPVPCFLGVHLYGWEKQAATITNVTTPASGPTTTIAAAPTLTHATTTPRPATTPTTTPRPATAAPLTAPATTVYSVTNKPGAPPALVGTFRELPGQPAQPPAAFANFTIVRQLFEQPTISQAAHILFPDAFTTFKPGWLLSANVLYQVDQPGTTVQPIEAELVISDSLTPAGIPPGTYRTPSILTSQTGSFRLQCKQSVTLPGTCYGVSFPRPPALRKLKVAVFGGGPAACTAALYLARQRDRYEVSLYTTGFRLGGKCQSWRNPDKAFRIEEHGLHAFLGFYRNAFTAVHDAYVSAFPEDGLGEALYLQAFHPEKNNGVMVFHKNVWTYCATPNLSRSAKAPAAANLHSGQALLLALEGALTRASDHLDAIAEDHPLLGAALHDARAELEQATTRLRSSVGAATSQKAALSSELLGGLPVAILIGIRDTIALIVRLDPNLSTYLWFLWTGVDTLLTIVIGVLEEPISSLNDLDKYDWRDWLRSHGLHEQGSERWAVIDQVYETLFAHQPPPPGRKPCAAIDEDVHAASLAAGVATRWYLLEAFGNHGATSFRFTYSCAQTIMTPLYLALEQLGAKVHFFHTVTALELAGTGPERRLVGVQLQRQAEVKAGPAAYKPLLTETLPNNPPELPDWPMYPHYDQLVDGPWFKANNIDFFDAWQTTNTRAKTIALRAGADFDLAVLGVPLGALPLIESPLTSPDDPAADPRWKAMIEGINVTQTMSFQLWFAAPSTQLLAEPRGLLTAYAQPEPSYGDFTPLIAYEDWPDPKPQYCAYFTGASYSGKPPLPPQCGPSYPADIEAAWNQTVSTWLEANYRPFFTGAGTPSRFPAFLNLLTAPGATTPQERLQYQHMIADVQPSNLYVLSQPGATALRFGQAESGVGALLLTGDWTRTDLNCGCVEAATSSGMLAARAISNEPASIWRPGF